MVLLRKPLDAPNMWKQAPHQDHMLAFVALLKGIVQVAPTAILGPRKLVSANLARHKDDPCILRRQQ
eukprot:5541451-Alexandrium_andersonii.AAC.1